MKVWGITGSIGMGKTTVARQFEACGVPVICSDAVVHELLAPGGEAVEEVAAVFPDTRDGRGINRTRLGARVFADAAARRMLEGILHPRVQEAQRVFAEKHSDAAMVLFDIPLLYETGAEKRLDGVIVATADERTQRERVLARPGMTEERFKQILALQMPDAEKRKRADIVIETGHGLAHSMEQVKQAIKRITRHA